MQDDRSRVTPELSAPTGAYMATVFNVDGRPMSSDEFFFKERTLFLFREVDDASAIDLVQKLHALNAADPSKEITLYINSPGGLVTAGLAILAAMDSVSCDIRTICTGQAASMASVILAHGTKGKRMIAPNSRVLIHQVRSGGAQGVISHQEVSVEESKRLNQQLAMYLAADSGQRVEDVYGDFLEDLWFNADQAIEYGLADAKTAINRPGVDKAGINPASPRADEILARRRAAKAQATKRPSVRQRPAPPSELAA